MPARMIVAVCLVALIFPGCGAVDNSVPIPPEEAAKINTTPTPEKSKAGKPNLNKTINE